MSVVRWLLRLRRRARAALFRSAFEREMDEEMRFHLEMEIEDRVRAGTSPGEARRTALRDFGGVDRYKEEARAARGLRAWDHLSQDVRFGVRVLARWPVFTVVAILTLAVGIGATTSVFTLANAVLFRPVPGVAEPDRLVQVRFRAPHLEDEETGLTYPNLVDLEATEIPAITHLIAWEDPRVQVAVPGHATAILGAGTVLGDYFDALGVRPASGRLIDGDETWIGEAEPIAVLSERARRRLFGDGAEPVGRTLLVNGVSFTVVGVAMDGFRGVLRGGDADLWIPYGMYPRILHADASRFVRRDRGGVNQFAARLAPGATPETAQTQLREAMARLIAAYPDVNEHFADYRPTVFPDIGLSPWAVASTRDTVELLMAVVALILLIACANVANLLISRGVRRQGESAMRRAMGASRRRLLGQHLTESGLLAAGGVLAGLVAAAALGRVLTSLRLPNVPPLEALPIDWRVVAFAGATGAATVILAGLVPAVVVQRVDLVRALKDAAPTETGRKGRVRSTLTLVQLALSLALLIGALLLGRTIRNLQGVELGFDPERVVEVLLDPRPQGYDQASTAIFQRDLLSAAADIRGVDVVTAAADGPLMTTYAPDLRPDRSASDEWPVSAWGDFVSRDYFDALRIPLLRGRTFTAREMDAGWRTSSEAAIVSETLARRLFGTVDAVGRTFVERGYRENTDLRVVGVVADSRVRDLDGPSDGVLYRPLGESMFGGFSLLIRSPRPAVEIAESVRRVVDRLDPAVPFYWARPLAERIRVQMAEELFLARLMSVLAALAALLAGTGLYAVVAFSVARRTREFGVRMALGASTATLTRLALGEAARLTVIGAAVGLAAAVGVARLLESRLFGVAPVDPATYGIAAIAFVCIALAAAAVPARAATRVDPAVALRYE